MKRMILVGTLVLSSLALGSTWEIDSAHAAGNFSVKHMMVSWVRGTLGEVTGKVELDESDLTKSKVEASIDLKAINTKQAKRDDHLRSADFFDVEKFPTLTFKSTKWEKGEGPKVKVTGELTMRGVTKTVTLDGELTPEVANPFNKAKTRGFSGTTVVNRKDFGLMWNKALEAGGVLVGDEVKVSVEAEMVKKEAAPGSPPPPPKK